jgi:transcriptional regulator with XRE-family HTH domain
VPQTLPFVSAPLTADQAARILKPGEPQTLKNRSALPAFDRPGVPRPCHLCSRAESHPGAAHPRRWVRACSPWGELHAHSSGQFPISRLTGKVVAGWGVQPHTKYYRVVNTCWDLHQPRWLHSSAVELLLTSTQQMCILSAEEYNVTFGKRLRQARKERGLTLRQLAKEADVNFTYLSKIENERVPYTPAAETIRELARILRVDSLEFLKLANKLPKELEPLNANVQARRFFDRASQVASPADWEALLNLLEDRQTDRKIGRKEAKKER